MTPKTDDEIYADFVKEDFFRLTEFGLEHNRSLIEKEPRYALYVLKVRTGEVLDDTIGPLVGWINRKLAKLRSRNV